MRDIPIQTATLLLVDQPDTRLVQLAQECGGTIVSQDAELRKSAEASGVPVVSVHELVQALLPKLRPDDEIEVLVKKPGQNADEGIGYLEDGTMVVVEHGRALVGATITVRVKSVMQTVAGRMVFSRPK